MSKNNCLSFYFECLYTAFTCILYMIWFVFIEFEDTQINEIFKVFNCQSNLGISKPFLM